MKFRELVSRLFGANKAFHVNDLTIPRFGGGTPHGHFREFTVPRRLQRGGVQLPVTRRTPRKCQNGIIPCMGENIP
ncbi:hypothetical protein H1235_07890 [Pseudoxanthomonas sp. NC8]|nr:hypothetical protein H1235_07890 [Pseudoxanthomonas sp. NC8]